MFSEQLLLAILAILIYDQLFGHFVTLVSYLLWPFLQDSIVAFDCYYCPFLSKRY